MGIIETVAALGLAVGYLLVAWRDGSLFEEWRAWLEDDGLVYLLPGYELPLMRWLTSLLLCPMCLSPWACGIIGLWLADSVYIWLLQTFGAAAVAYGVWKHLTFNR